MQIDMKSLYEQDKTVNYVDTITPTLTELSTQSGYNLSYHWTLPDGRNIFLHIFLSREKTKDGSPAILAKSNLDSSEVRGQGKHIWNFLTKKLEEIGNTGYGNIDPAPLMHETTPNEYAEKIVASAPGYKAKGNKYYKIY